MPIYEYKCEICGLKFEDLRTPNEKSEIIPCHHCGSNAHKVLSVFSSSVSGGSINETVDMQIGRQANKRWQNYHDRQSKRHENHELKTFDLPQSKKDGKYMPIMGLGNGKEIADRHEYVDALQEHRKRRVEKGLSQFAEKGAF